MRRTALAEALGVQAVTHPTCCPPGRGRRRVVSCSLPLRWGRGCTRTQPSPGREQIHGKGAAFISLFIVTRAHPKRFTIFPDIHPFMHTFTHRQRCQPCRATASSSGAVDLDTQLGGAGDRTSNLAVTSKPARPPELHAAP